MKKKLEDLHKKHNVYPEYKDFYLSYTYDRKTNDWEFLGYRCTKCGRVFKKDKTVPSHYQNCKTINYKPVYKTNEIDDLATVRTIDGREWRPLDFNQILSVQPRNDISES